MTGAACQQTLHAMNSPNTTGASAVIDDLYTLILADGLALESAGKAIKYRTVKLRETNVADERMAQRLAERVVLVGGTHKLLVSDADFGYAMTMRHIDQFICDGQAIPQAMIDLDMFGKLSNHDLVLIEQRVFLLTMAAEVRYGTMTQAEFDLVMGGQVPAALASGAKPPQHLGQAAAVGQVPADAESGPALLADYLGSPANSAA